MDTHRSEREQRDATRKAAWDSAARNEGVNRNLQGMSGGAKKGTLADEMENEIDGNLDALHGAAKRLNALGKAMGEEVDTQNSKLTRIRIAGICILTPLQNTLTVSLVRRTRWTTRSP
jgi:hypothetical protein